MSTNRWNVALALAALGFCSAIARAEPPCPPPQVSVDGGSSVSTPCPSSQGVYSTRFPLAENPLSEGGKWVDGKARGLDWNNPKSSTGFVYASVQSGIGASRYDDSIAHLDTAFRAFGADQYAQGTVYLANGYSGASHEVELLLRFSIGPHDAHGYEILWGLKGYIAVVRWNGPRGDYTALYDPGVGSVPVPHDGDVLRAEVRGSTITVILNGKAVASVNLSVQGGKVWSAGQPGIGFWPVDGATPEKFGWKSFEAGNL